MRLDRKRSESGGRWVPGVALLALAAPVALVAAGCEFAPELEEIMERPLMYKEMDLSPTALEERMRQIDEHYAEPRTPTKVQLSYELSLDSISKVDGYEALWRGARACSWLALNDPAPGRRKEYAEKGIRMGMEAVKKTSTKVESYYFLALCMGGHAKEMTGTPSVGFLRRMHERMQMARALDERFDYCGPHRFIGELMVRTADYPVWAIGTLDKGLEHLKTATVLCPDFGENHLMYAKALGDDGDEEGARRELERVLTCPPPPDYTADHQEWLKDATQLLTEMQQPG